jgi:hypothetical protein
VLHFILYTLQKKMNDKGGKNDKVPEPSLIVFSQQAVPLLGQCWIYV